MIRKKNGKEMRQRESNNAESVGERGHKKLIETKVEEARMKREK